MQATKLHVADSTHSIRILFEIVSSGGVYEFTKKVCFLSSVTACLYHCELQTPESASDLSYPQLELGLRCSHYTVLVEPHFPIFCLKRFLHFDYQNCFAFSKTAQ